MQVSLLSVIEKKNVRQIFIAETLHTIIPGAPDNTQFVRTG